ncbi:tripartite tricarboxylate transporter substrate binding protein [Vineibacter terrae]|uniref:Tripartite tricarboxylate transporter substrate binding protein n=1 Tax=Vineibacter terrae TaxID=2586908 RepID=A0A5C8PJM9_9HYPH|nr:tripartite tricarboxylate transporter substrate binding protein [Vineibacter terrae]TXL73456.1 tripartite tricarboxylate transporter substrate binding protein [Vineibacter terrae]
MARTLRRPLVASMLLAVGATLSMAAARAESADTFPSKPITIIVNFGAGGPTDLPPRRIAAYLEKKFKQPVVVENRTGGAGVVGLSAVARAAPDGYTLGTFSASPTVIAPRLRTVPYNARKDFTPVAQIAEYAMPLCVLPTRPWKSVADLMAHARANPGAVTYSTVGTGSGQHIFMEALAKAEKVKLAHVPFSGGAGGIAALLGGHVQGALDAALAKHAATGECRALASVGSARHPALPDVPTFKELGYTIDAALWLGLAGPAGMPQAIVDKLSAAILEATEDPSYKDLLKQLLLGDKTAGSAAFRAQVAADDERMAAMMNDLGMTAPK